MGLVGEVDEVACILEEAPLIASDRHGDGREVAAERWDIERKCSAMHKHVAHPAAAKMSTASCAHLPWHVPYCHFLQAAILGMSRRKRPRRRRLSRSTRPRKEIFLRTEMYEQKVLPPYLSDQDVFTCHAPETRKVWVCAEQFNKPACYDADGKIIKAASVSVQSNRTYEQEFALEMQKAQVWPLYHQWLTLPLVYCIAQNEVLRCWYTCPMCVEL